MNLGDLGDLGDLGEEKSRSQFHRKKVLNFLKPTPPQIWTDYVFQMFKKHEQNVYKMHVNFWEMNLYCGIANLLWGMYSEWESEDLSTR